MTTLLKVMNTCLLCQYSAKKCKKSTTTWYFMYTKRGKLGHLKKKIDFSLGLQENIIKSGCICRNCFKKVNKLFEFKEKCFKTLGMQSKILELLGQFEGVEDEHEEDEKNNHGEKEIMASKQPPRKRPCRRLLQFSASASCLPLVQSGSDTFPVSNASPISNLLTSTPNAPTNPPSVLPQNSTFIVNSFVLTSPSNVSNNTNDNSVLQRQNPKSTPDSSIISQPDQLSKLGMEQASESQRDNSQVRPTSLSDQGSTELITLPKPVAEQIENVNGNVNESGQNFVNSSQSRQFDSDNTVKTALEKSARIGFLNQTEVSSYG